MEEKRNVCRVFWGKPEIGHLVDVEVDSWKIPKWTLKKENARSWTD